ncbi:glycoside hydrolase family 97 protein [Streptomyces sp. SID14478]|uniref:glycoside hydrolase family 97 protein n=1 Tax=Streptomyces sp. SID14478 TaxID=2706073 RepID=UPI0013DC7670|nr:glycoside hydrolase family 97 protein [Streptomyces sp. SID14478]NEB74787.1 glycoside hydrolase family 97 protein [Streptomyces sp. SID14478]
MRIRPPVLFVALVTAAMAGSVLVPSAQADDRSWAVSRGGAGPTAALRLDDEGRLSLGIRRQGRTVLAPGALGIVTDEGDLTSGLKFVRRTDTRVHEDYSTTVGKRRRRTVDQTESRFAFVNREGAALTVVVRAAADGIAYRYVVPDAKGDGVKVTEEASTFELPDDASAWINTWSNGNYEAAHQSPSAAGAADGDYAYPALFRTRGTGVHGDYALLSESDVTGTYDGSHLAHTQGEGEYRVALADDEVDSPGPLSTPWRTVTTGDLATVTQSTLNDDVAPASRVQDASWIRPGKVAWSWMDGGHEAQRSLEKQKSMVDYAAEHHWEYTLVDDGWNTTDWMPELTAYAKERGVKILLWMNYADVDTADEQKAMFDQLAQWGVVGVKIDFMDSDQQARYQWYDGILKETAARHLLVDFHGSTIPHGIARTWPQVMSMEAVHGAEQLNVTAANVSVLPYTRNVVGSMDFTPMDFQTGRIPVSDAAELALSVVYESGFQNFAGALDEYRKRPELEKFLEDVPTAWDETRLVAGDPGKKTTLARRDGDRWFLGNVNAGAAHTEKVPLRFLGHGTYTIDVVRDGPDGLVRESRTVTARDTLTVDVPADGGFAAVAHKL